MILRWPEQWPEQWPSGRRRIGPHPPSVTLPRGSVVHALVELRDVAPTLLDAAGALPTWATEAMDGSSSKAMDGSSLLCFLGAGGCPSWRALLGLEHNTCYNASNHWNAIIDGHIKYIFHAQHATEQLFDLGADPYERNDLAASPAHAATLTALRAALVAQFEREGRGPVWVRPNGTLPARPESQNYGPNYPGKPPPAGDVDEARS